MSLDPDSSTQLILLAVCLLLSAFFSCSETAILSMSKIRLLSLADEGGKNARLLQKMLKNPDRVISAILVGNNFVNISASALVTAFVIDQFGEPAVGYATGAVTLMVLIFGEITPKSLAYRYSDRIALFVAKPIYALSIVLTPVVFLLNALSNLFLRLFGGHKAKGPSITEQELRTMVDVSTEEGVLEAEEKQMIHNVFEFGDGEVREIMTPRVNVVSIPMNASFDELLDIMKEEQFSRFPVYDESPDYIAGIVNIKDFAINGFKRKDFSLKDIVRPANYVYEFNNISRVFNDMRKNRVQMSIVLDEYGILSGLVTMEDFIEEIVGEIMDEYDEEEMLLIQQLGEREYLVDGTLPIDTFNESLGANVVSDDFDSIGGFVIGKVGELPDVGQTVELDDLVFTIERVENNRIERMKVKLPIEQ